MPDIENLFFKAQIKIWTLTLLIIFGSFATPAVAVIEIEITQGGENAIPIAIVPFGWEGSGKVPEDIAGIVTADLQRSGNFSPLNRQDLVATPVSGDVPRFANWRLSGADFLLIGGVRPEGVGYIVEFQLFDVLQQSLLSGFSFQVTDQTLRSAAHQISDEPQKSCSKSSAIFLARRSCIDLPNISAQDIIEAMTSITITP